MRSQGPDIIMTLEEARRRRDLGAAHLDSVMPGWERSIDVSRLRMQGANDCVLGQLRGWMIYSGMENAIALAEAEGFLLNIPMSTNKSLEELYAPLTQAWTELITERLSK